MVLNSCSQDSNLTLFKSGNDKSAMIILVYYGITTNDYLGFIVANQEQPRFVDLSLWTNYYLVSCITVYTTSKFTEIQLWSRRQESNLQPADYKSAALPVELRRRFFVEMVAGDGFEPPTSGL